MTPGIQAVMRAVESTWDRHVAALFDGRDVGSALSGADPDLTVRHLPTGAGGTGLTEVREFYTEVLVPTLPRRLLRIRHSRTVDVFRLVEESTWRFSHDHEMGWLAPGVAALGNPVELLVVEIATFRQGRLAGRRVLWDQADVLRQLAVPGDVRPGPAG